MQQQGSIFTQILNAQKPQPAPPQMPPQMPQGGPQMPPQSMPMPPPQMPQMPPQAAPQGFATGGNVAAPAFRGYDTMDALSNIANSGNAFWLRDPKTGKASPAIQAQVDQQRALGASRTPQRGEQRYGFVRFGEGMHPEKDNHSYQEKFSNTKGAGLWAIGINPDDPQAEQKAKAYIERVLANPKYKTGVWGNTEWGRDDAKMPGVRQLIAQNPNISYAQLADYAKRAPQAQNALDPRDIGLDIGAALAMMIPYVGPGIAATIKGFQTIENEGDFGDFALAVAPALSAYMLPGPYMGASGVVNGISTQGLLPYLGSQVTNAGNALASVGNYARGVAQGAGHLLQTGNPAMLTSAILPQVNNVNALMTSPVTGLNVALPGVQAGASSAMRGVQNAAGGARSLLTNQAAVNSGVNALKVAKAQSDAADAAAKAAGTAGGAAGGSGGAAGGAGGTGGVTTDGGATAPWTGFGYDPYNYMGLVAPSVTGYQRYAKGGVVRRNFDAGGLNRLPNPTGLPVVADALYRPQTQPMPAMPPMPAMAPPPAPKLQSLYEKYAASPEMKAAAEAVRSERKNYIDSMRQAMLDTSEQPSRSEMYFRLASALASPTKTGTPGETLSNASAVLADSAKEETAARRANRAAQIQFLMEEKKLTLADAEKQLERMEAIGGKLLEAELREPKAPESRKRTVFDPDGELYELTEEFDPATRTWNKVSQVPAGAKSKTAQAQALAEKRAGDGGDELGSSLEAKAYSYLIRGVKDPSVLSTPEYAAAWDVLNKPRPQQVYDELTGEYKITMVQPKLDPMFKPPVRGAASVEPAKPAEGAAPVTTQEPTSPAASPSPVEQQQPGTVTKPGLNTLTPAEAVEYRKQILTLDEAISLLNRFEQSVEQNGLLIFSTGKAAGEQSSLYSELLVALKDKAGLGALTGPDMGIMTRTIGDPQAFRENIGKGFSPETLLSQIGSVRTSAQNKKKSLLGKLPGAKPSPMVYDPRTGQFSGGKDGK